MEDKRRDANKVIQILKEKYIVYDVRTAKRVRERLMMYKDKAAMMHSLSAVFSGEENIQTYLREMVDDTSKKVLKNAVDEKMEVLDDFGLFNGGGRNAWLYAETKDILKSFHSTLEIDIACRDLVTGKIDLPSWVWKHKVEKVRKEVETHV